MRYKHVSHCTPAVQSPYILCFSSSFPWPCEINFQTESQLRLSRLIIRSRDSQQVVHRQLHTSQRLKTTTARHRIHPLGPPWPKPARLYTRARFGLGGATRLRARSVKSFLLPPSLLISHVVTACCTPLPRLLIATRGGRQLQRKREWAREWRRTTSAPTTQQWGRGSATPNLRPTPLLSHTPKCCCKSRSHSNIFASTSKHSLKDMDKIHLKMPIPPKIWLTLIILSLCWIFSASLQNICQLDWIWIISSKYTQKTQN